MLGETLQVDPLSLINLNNWDHLHVLVDAACSAYVVGHHWCTTVATDVVGSSANFMVSSTTISF